MPERIPVIAIFDIGKTNKKILLFNEDYKIVFEQSTQFEECIDEDGDPCDDIIRIRNWALDFLYVVCASDEFDLRAVNVSAYGASFVHIDSEGNLLTPLYNYLKSYPEDLKKMFYQKYGDEQTFAKQTASPILGSLNSGLQLYRLKHKRPEIFKHTKYSLHLPQYLIWLFTKQAYADLTSIGCHTGLWDFEKQNYHQWVFAEKIHAKFPSIIPSDQILQTAVNNKQIIFGSGLHDSSAALIPYMSCFNDPFILISTGTWCISLNPFNHESLTIDELNNDCLCYISYKGVPVKASRLFAGYEHEKQTQFLSEYYQVHHDYYKTVKFDSQIIARIYKSQLALKSSATAHQKESTSFSDFVRCDLSSFKNYTEAYHNLIFDIVRKQIHSTRLIITKSNNIKRIFVDGGFSNNEIYMNLLADAFPELDVFGASIPQASALGSALSIHHHWNSKSISHSMIQLKQYGIKHHHKL